MFDYENAFIKMFKATSYAPLTSWEFSGLNVYGAIAAGREMQCIKHLEKENKWGDVPDVKNAFLSKKTVVVTNLQKEIIWVSQQFYFMTGYLPAEAIGKKPNILQGPKTCKIVLANMKEKLLSRQTVNDEIINYKKNGEEYLCRLQIFPIFNVSKKPVNYLAIEYAF